MFKIINWLLQLLDFWLEPVPSLIDLSSTDALIGEGRQPNDADIEAALAERELQSYDRANPYV